MTPAGILVQALGGTKTYRTILMTLVLSTTPIGQNVLESLGVRSPANKQGEEIAVKVDALSKEVADLKLEAKDNVKAVADVKTQVNKLENSFTGFQVDLNKYRPQPAVSPTPATQPQ